MGTIRQNVETITAALMSTVLWLQFQSIANWLKSDQSVIPKRQNKSSDLLDRFDEIANLILSYSIFTAIT